MDETSAAERKLKEQRHAIAGQWYAAISATSFSTKSAREVHKELSVLSGKAIRLLGVAPLDTAEAEAIGSSLARLHYIKPEALDGTLRVLGEELGGMRPVEGAVEYLDRLAALLRGISTGFFREGCSVMLAEQEAIRAALLAEIKASGRALREAHAELEQRVADRTAELARSNEELRTEVTERQRIEDALRESEEKYRRLVEDMGEVVYAADLDGVLTYVSPSVEAMLGYKPAELLGHPVSELVYPEDLDRIRYGLQSLLAGREQTAEYRFVAKSGDVRWGRTSSSPIVDGSRIVGLHGLLADVTDAVQAEEALQASEERWRLLVQNAPVLVATMGPDLRVRFINRVPGQVLSRVEVVGADALAFVVPSHRDAGAAAIHRVFETGDSEYLEVAVVSSRRSDAWYGIHFGPLWREGRVVEVMLVAVDVTEERRIAEMKDNLIRDVSHELRTPLAKVQMSLGLLMELLEKEELDRGKAIRVSGFATRSTERMLRTVEDILDLTRLDAGMWADEQQVFRPQVLIREAIVYTRPLAAAKGLELASDLPEALPMIQGDWDKLYRVLRNLIANAIKFSEEGKVTVTAEERSGELLIGVHDQGQGISAENLERIFERFFQEKTRHPGAGLGLAICKTIIEQYGGRIWAESAGRGKGATVWFTAPTEACEE